MTVRTAGLAFALVVLLGVLALTWGDDQAWRTCDAGGAVDEPTLAPVTAPAAVSLTPVSEAEDLVGAAFHPATGEMFTIAKSGAVAAGVDLLAELEVSSGYEQGLLGIAISPSGDMVVLDYTDVDGTTRVVGFALTHDTDGRPSLGEPWELLAIAQPAETHNGGHVAFAPDGTLLIGTGDGRSGIYTEEYPANGHVARDPNSPLGKILRIAVDESAAVIPADNPFPLADAPETYVTGMRNPWRFSIDPATGDLWVGDVGQGCFEEITRLPAGRIAGASLGWDAYEGPQRYAGEPIDDAVPPLFAYPHADGRCSVVGGQVYRGQAIPELAGTYVFGDTCSGELMALVPQPGETYGFAVLTQAVPQLVSFAVDPTGELYTVSLTQGISRLVPAS